MDKAFADVSKQLRKLTEKVERIDGELQELRSAAGKDSSTQSPGTSRGRRAVLWMVRNWGKVLSGLLAFTVAWINYQQWHDAHRTFEAEQRAWLKIHFDWPDSTKPESLLHAMVTFTNIGKATITRFDGEGKAEVLPLDVGPSLTLKIPHGSVYSNIVAPGEPTEFAVEFGQTEQGALPLSQQDMDDLLRGRKYMVAYGVVEYNDQFGPHWYRFCSYKAYSDSVTKLPVAKCVGFNDIGDGHVSLDW